jgi:NADPH2:quinone reductase
MAKAAGATVISTVSTGAKAELSKDAGADYVINYAEDDFESVVNDITKGEGIDVAYDSVGVSTFDKSIACLKPCGYMVLYGQASGPVPPVPTSALFAKSLFLTRPGLGHYTITREDLLERANDVLGWVASGKLKLRIHNKFALKDAPEAHRQLKNRETTGKLLLVP